MTSLCKKEFSVSAPMQGDDYVLVKKSDLASGKGNCGEALQSDSKEEKKKTKTLDDDGNAVDVKTLLVMPVRMNSSGVGGRGIGIAKTVLVYDFTITPSTSSALSSTVALQPSQDTQFTNHWIYLYSEMRMEKAEIILNFGKYINLVGESGQLPAFNCAYRSDASTQTQTYTMVSDYTTSKMVNWSPNKPVFKYSINKKMLKMGWTPGVEATTASIFYKEWVPTNVTATSAMSCGFWHFCSYDASGVASRPIVGKLKMWITFRGKL